MERRSGTDRRSNVVALESPVPKEVLDLARWFQSYLETAREHSVIVMTCGPELECRVFHAGHARRYAYLMAGKLSDMLPSTVG